MSEPNTDPQQLIPCREFTIGDIKGHHLSTGDSSVLAISTRFGLVYHNAVPYVNNQAVHRFQNLVIETECDGIVHIGNNSQE